MNDPVNKKKRIDLVMKAFGTVCRVVIPVSCDKEENDRQIIKAIRDYLMDMDDRLSVFKADSEISLLNHAGAGKNVRVTPDTYDLLKKAKLAYEETNGVFDVTLGRESASWRKERKLPEERDRYQKEKAFGLSFDDENQSVCMTCENLAVDLGGIAKGYALDKIRAMLLDFGIEQALIDLGGTILPMGQEKRVGLQNPFLPMNQNHIRSVFADLLCKDMVIATSGIYEQYHDSDKCSHHILDPKTGTSALSDLLSATVISESGTMADVYATTLIVLGLERGICFAGQKGIEVVLVTKNGDTYVSESLKKKFHFRKVNAA